MATTTRRNWDSDNDNQIDAAAVEAGAGSPLTTKGDIEAYDTAPTRLPVGSDGQVLTANSATATGLEWSAAGTSGVATEDEGISVDPTATTLNFVGAGVTATDSGSNVTTVTIPGGTSGIATEDEGISVDPTATTLNFVGAGVTATDAGSNVTTVTIPGGGGASPLTTKGDLYTYDTADQRLPVGTDGQILSANSATATGLEWIANTGGGGGSGGPAEITRLTKSSPQTITNGTLTDITFDGEDYDDEGLHDNVTNPERLTIVEDGTYYLLGQIEYAVNVTGERTLEFQLNGTTRLAINRGPAAPSSETRIQVSCISKLTAGDYVTLRAQQNTGGNLDVLAGNSLLSAVRLEAGGGTGGSGGNSSLSVGLAAWWKLDEVSGIRNDSSGNGNYLTDNNTVGSQAGLLGNEAVFVRANTEYLERPVDTLIPFQTDQVFSFSCWVTLDQTTDNQSIAGLFRTSGGADRKWLLQFGNAPGIRILLSEDAGATTSDDVTILASPVIGTRYHIVVAVDSLNQTLRCYVDGSEVVNQATNVSSLHIPASSTTFTLGSRSGSTDDLDGKLDECAYWSRAITADEVSKLYNSGAGITLDDLAN